MARPVTQGGIDYPDGGFTGGVGLYSLIGDLAELAVRLGSPDTFNREGCVLFMDSFETGVSRWDTSGTGADAAIIASAEKSQTGGYSCKFDVDATAARQPAILRYFPYPQLVRYGLEVSVEFSGDFDVFYFIFLLNTGTETISYFVRYDDGENTIEYIDSDGVFQTLLTDVDLNDDSLHFVTLKLVVDFLGRTYDRLIINESETDMSSLDAYVVSVTATPTAYVQIRADTLANEAFHCYIDDVIVTRNEPARRED